MFRSPFLGCLSAFVGVGFEMDCQAEGICEACMRLHSFTGFQNPGAAGRILLNGFGDANNKLAAQLAAQCL